MILISLYMFIFPYFSGLFYSREWGHHYTIYMFRAVKWQQACIYMLQNTTIPPLKDKK